MSLVPALMPPKKSTRSVTVPLADMLEQEEPLIVDPHAPPTCPLPPLPTTAFKMVENPLFVATKKKRPVPKKREDTKDAEAKDRPKPVPPTAFNAFIKEKRQELLRLHPELPKARIYDMALAAYREGRG